MSDSTMHVHMLVVWPAAVSKMHHIPEQLAALDGTLLHGIRIHPNKETLEHFIYGIYSGSRFDMDRIDEKKQGILSHLSAAGIIVAFFTLNGTEVEWNEARGRNIFPEILLLKDRIRHSMEEDLKHLVSIYETVHITDDMIEFSNDFSELMKMICESSCEYIDAGAFQSPYDSIP